MKGLRHPATMIALLALFVACGGTAVAATSYINGKQIKNHSIAAKKLTRGAIHQLRGRQGPAGVPGKTGATGPAGAPGNTGPSGVVAIASWAGFDTGVPAHSTAFTFDGPTTTVTTNGSQRVTASGSITLQTNTGTADLDVAICVEPSSGAYITELGNALYQAATATTTRSTVTTAQSGVLPADTWKIGMCVFDQSAQPVNANGSTTGYAFVTN